MALAAGARLGPYEIVAPLGSGGMGEVYRARDTRLDRSVALKVLPATLAADPAARARFEREAKAVAALSHPNILAIHEFGTHDGLAYTITELLDGETLRTRLEAGPIVPRKAIDYATQIARGLAAAHDKGIVHRDLKPENLFVTSDGRVKILDFGLARPAVVAAGATQSIAPTVLETDPGVVMGTAGYMSPEQVRGQTVDSRSDLFAFGAVLYEMLSGRRAFQRDTAAETMTAILKEEPPEIAPPLPPNLDRIVRRCLEKNPAERFQSARDLAFALENVDTASSSSGRVAAIGPPAAGTRRRWTSIALVALALGGASGWWIRGRQQAGDVAPPAMFTQLTDFPGMERSPTLSPDGKTVVYAGDSSGNLDIYSLRVGGRNPVNLTQDSASDDSTPAFSPNGEQIAFRSERAGGGIFVMGATGESIRRVTDFGYDPSWSPDGRNLVVGTIPVQSPYNRSGTGELFIVSVASGERRQLNVGRDAMQPSWSPHRIRIAFWSVERGTGQRHIWTVPADGGEPLAITHEPAVDWNPVWAPDGRHLYFASDRAGVMNLWRVPIDEESGKPLGPTEPLHLPVSQLSGFSLDARGRVVFSALDQRSTLQRVDFDPATETVAGSALPLLQTPRSVRWLDWSPDDETLAFSTFAVGDNLYLIRSDGTGYRQLTDDAFRNRGPRWFADGSGILFYSNRGGSYQAWSIRADGSGLQQLTNFTGGVILPVPSPTGAQIAFSPSLSDKWMIADLRSPGAERPEDMTARADRKARGLNPTSWSRDGKRILLFPVAGIRRGMVVYNVETRQYTDLNAEGTDPRWLPDSRRLMFLGTTGVILLDSMTGRRREVFRLPSKLAAPTFGFALSADGRRLAVIVLEQQSDLWMLGR